MLFIEFWIYFKFSIFHQLQINSKNIIPYKYENTLWIDKICCYFYSSILKSKHSSPIIKDKDPSSHSTTLAFDYIY